MKAYLLTWNPTKWNWRDIRAARSAAANSYKIEWRCRNSHVQPGDLLVWMCVGSHPQYPKGIFAIGEAIGRTAISPTSVRRYVPTRVKELRIPGEDKIIALDVLRREFGRSYNWTPQGSGVTLPETIAERVLELWGSEKPGGSGASEAHLEGTRFSYLVSRPERDAKARAVCIRLFGNSCAACGMKLADLYGPVADGVIEVHHLDPISQSKGERVVDPKTDLRPLCPNCHAVAHQRNPPFSIAEIKSFLQSCKR